MLGAIYVGKQYMLGNSYPTHIACCPTHASDTYVTLYTLDMCIGLHVGFVDEVYEIIYD